MDERYKRDEGYNCEENNKIPDYNFLAAHM